MFFYSADVKSLNDFQQLQLDIDRLVAWSKLWQLNFNVNKYILSHLIIMVITILMDLLHYQVIVLKICMGILIDNQLKFHEHSSIVAGRANRTLAIIRKSFEYVDKETFIIYSSGLFLNMQILFGGPNMWLIAILLQSTK